MGSIGRYHFEFGFIVENFGQYMNWYHLTIILCLTNTINVTVSLDNESTLRMNNELSLDGLLYGRYSRLIACKLCASDNFNANRNLVEI